MIPCPAIKTLITIKFYKATGDFRILKFTNVRERYAECKEN